MRPIAISFFAATALLATSSAAMAHPKLVSAKPAADSTVSKPTEIVMTFSEALVAPLTGIELTMTGMPGMANHAPMPIKGFTTKIEGKTLTAKMPRALPAGTYQLKWHAVAGDQHRIENSYNFTVK
jgi:methionine-rich copper-binding protein CopC